MTILTYKKSKTGSNFEIKDRPSTDLAISKLKTETKAFKKPDLKILNEEEPKPYKKTITMQTPQHKLNKPKLQSEIDVNLPISKVPVSARHSRQISYAI